MKFWWIETQAGAFLLVLHDVMVSTFKFGGNRIFFGVDTADFVGCRDGTRPSDFLSYPTSLSQTLPLFKARWLGHQAVFLFENASNHTAFAADALCVTSINLSFGGN